LSVASSMADEQIDAGLELMALT